MDIWQMRYFIQIYNDKSLTKAAKNLYISQQCLSKTIKNIENEFHILLFERSSRGLQPTTEGELLLEKAQHILNDYNELLNIFNKKEHLNNNIITIGIADVLFTKYLRTYICNFQEEHPDITIKYYELGYYNCEKFMDDNLIDICITLKPDTMYKYNFIPLSEYNLILLVNEKNELSKKAVVKVKDLKSESFIMLPTDCKIRKLTIDSCLKSNFNPNIVITTSNIDFIIELINLNKGIAIVPEFHSIKASIMSNNIAAVCLDHSLSKIETGFIIRKGRIRNTTTDILIKYLSDAINSNRIK